MVVFTVARELYCGLRRWKYQASVQHCTHIARGLITACLPPFPSVLLVSCSSPLSLPLPFSLPSFILGPSGPSSTIFTRVTRSEITGGLIICWSCESRSRGNAPATIKRLKERVAGSFWRPTRRTPYEIFSYCRVSSVKSVISERMRYHFFLFPLRGISSRREPGNWHMASTTKKKERNFACVKFDIFSHFFFIALRL